MLHQTASSLEILIGKLGGLDTLVLNSPAPKKGGFEQLAMSDWADGVQKILNMHLEAIYSALPALKKSKSGRLIFVLSTAAKEPIAGLLISSTLRAGVLGLMKSLSREFAPFGITVNAVLPGYTETPGINTLLNEDKKNQIQHTIPLNKLALVCDHGALISFLSEERNNYITGQAIAVDGGLLQGI
jgi:3-oxoacyl-[acyl-carrier protein] reductase